MFEVILAVTIGFLTFVAHVYHDIVGEESKPQVVKPKKQPDVKEKEKAPYKVPTPDPQETPQLRVENV